MTATLFVFSLSEPILSWEILGRDKGQLASTFRVLPPNQNVTPPHTHPWCPSVTSGSRRHVTFNFHVLSCWRVVPPMASWLALDGGGGHSGSGIPNGCYQKLFLSPVIPIVVALNCFATHISLNVWMPPRIIPTHASIHWMFEEGSLEYGLQKLFTLN